jgi:deoxyhypusine synthase
MHPHKPSGIQGGQKNHKFLDGARIDPTPIAGAMTVKQLIDGTFQAYNAARLREACHLFTAKMLEPDVTVGLTITGALTPAGLGMSALIPLLENGFVDWIISTGANLYHDTHYGIGLTMHRGNPQTSDVVLRDHGVVRIYDIFFDYEVLLSTDAFFREVITAPRCRPRNSITRWASTSMRAKSCSGRGGSPCLPPRMSAACQSIPHRPGTARLG